ncbi:MAG: hypothetical protein AAF206_20710, partial [Bacteroidota bacterium]
MKRYFLFIACLIGAAMTFAQNESDALRHSQSTLTGTARALGMGGAFSAAGADMSAGTLNPAGFALFRSNKFSISPILRITQTDTRYLGENDFSSRGDLNVANW